jgi:hypothetical protein
LDPVNINRVNLGPIICEQSSQRSTDFRAIDDYNCTTEEAVSVREGGVVNLEIFEDFDNGERSTRENRLLLVVWRIEEPDILVLYILKMNLWGRPSTSFSKATSCWMYRSWREERGKMGWSRGP